MQKKYLVIFLITFVQKKIYNCVFGIYVFLKKKNDNMLSNQ